MRARVVLTTVLAMAAAGLSTFAATAPAQAVQATGDDAVTWAVGNSWTYNGTTFNYNDGQGTNVTITENVTYTVGSIENFGGHDAYKLNISGSITGCTGNANAGGTSVGLSNCSGTVGGSRFVRRSDLALLQENQLQHLNGRAAGLVNISADIDLSLTPGPSWKIHDFPLNAGDSWTTATDVEYTGGFTYDAGSFGSGESPFDGTLPVAGPSSVSNANVTVAGSSVATKRILTTGNDGVTSDDSYWSPAHKNDVKETLVLPLDGATLTLNRTLSNFNIGAGVGFSNLTNTPSYTCAGDTVAVTGTTANGVAGQTVTARVDTSQVSPGSGSSASATTGANGVFTINVTAPSASDGLNRAGAQPSRGNYGIVVSGGGSTGVTTLVVNNTNCSSIAYTGAIAAPTGSNATVSATLTDKGNQGRNAGKTVTFTLSGGGSINAVTDGSGVATASLPITGSPRSATITASYAGAANVLQAASTNAAFTVQTVPTTTAVVANPQTQTIGDPITFTATVSPAYGANPTGQVQFQVDGADFGTPIALSGGQATSAALSTLTLGFHNVKAIYLGSADHSGSTSPTIQVRVRNPLLGTTTALVVDPTTSVAGQNVNLKATVTKASGSDPLLGNVTFFDNNSTILGTTAPNGSGVAELDLTTIPVGAHSITAVYAGDDVYAGSSSAPVGTNVAKAGVTVDLQSSDTSTVTGEAVNFTASVSPVAPGAGLPTGTAQLVIDGSNVGAPQPLTGGAVAFAPVSNLGAGAHTVAVSYSGDANFLTGNDSLTQNVAKADTTNVVLSGPSPQVEEELVTITATIAATAPGSGSPTGTVTFFADGDEIGSAALAPAGGSSQAVFTTPFLPVGTHQITAEYNGDADYNGSDADAVTQIVIAAAEVVATTTTVTSSANPSTYGEFVTYTAHVAAEDGSTPLGSVQFSIDGTDLGAPVLLDANGNAESPTISSPEPGDHLVIAAFASSAAYAASGDTVTQQVDSASVSVDLSSSNANSNYGQGVSFHAAVSSNAAGTGTPGGFVQFRVDGVALGNAVALDGAGEATSPTTTSLAPGAHTITAVYSGDAHFLGETATLTQNVGVIGTSTSLAASTTSPTFGDTVTLTATVTPGSNALGSPTGTVTFVDGSTPLGTVPLASVGNTGKATFTTSSLGGGAHPIKAVYNPTSAFGGSTSNTVTVTVAKKATTIKAEAALIRLNPLLGINLGLLKATLTTATGPLAGQPVVFTVGNATVCTSTTDGAGVAKCDAFPQLLQLTLAGGYKATYAGNGNYAAATDNGTLIK